jgi:cation:H+ antiporter
VTVLLILGGLIALVAGGEVLVRGASALARAFGMSPLIVGLTVVSAATSAPELAVTVDASLTGSPGIALGNVVGSNIINVLLILGASAIVLPLAVSSQLVKADVPVLIVMSGITLAVALDGVISRLDGVLLFVLLMGYLLILVRITRRRKRNGGVQVPEADPADRPVAWNVGFVVVGVALLVLGARGLVLGATDIAQSLGLSDLVIGLTVVAVGTSLPELATSVTAAIRGEREMAVGNVAGSNIFNLGLVLAAAGILAPEGVPVSSGALELDLPFMVAVALALLPLAFTGFEISRFEGVVLVAYYVAYTAYLLLDAAGHDALEPFSSVMLLFVAPLTVLWLVFFASFELGLRRGRRQVKEEFDLPLDPEP